MGHWLVSGSDNDTEAARDLHEARLEVLEKVGG